MGIPNPWDGYAKPMRTFVGGRTGIVRARPAGLGGLGFGALAYMVVWTIAEEGSSTSMISKSTSVKAIT
jgi:hypothetical protein